MWPRPLPFWPRYSSPCKSIQNNPTENGLVEITVEAYDQHGDLVLTDVTEAVVKCKPL